MGRSSEDPEASMSSSNPLRHQIKTLIVESLRLEGRTPESIGDDLPLFGPDLGLDSVDALELVVALEREFGIRIQSHEVGRETFASVSSLASFLESRLAAEQGQPRA
jgi:acyl carrier protein